VESKHDQRSGSDEARNDLTQRRREIFLRFYILALTTSA
jgi:hypothetical protein